MSAQGVELSVVAMIAHALSPVQPRTFIVSTLKVKEGGIVPSGWRKTEDACGRPMGIRVDKWGYLVVADAYSGLFRMDSRNGQLLLSNTSWLLVIVTERNSRANIVCLQKSL